MRWLSIFILLVVFLALIVVAKKPKKVFGENSKAVLAKVRKAAIQNEERQKREKQIEDEYWKDDDKLILKKQSRKDEKEKKKIEQQLKKEQNKLLLETEMELVTSKVSQTKLTRSQIEKNISEPTLKPKKVEQEPPLIENLNRLSSEGDEGHTVDEAIQILNGKEIAVDKHPEKRMKAAYANFKNQNLDRLKTENPTLRLLQVKLLLRKEWLKSFDNPRNNL